MNLRKHLSGLKLFPALLPIHSVAINILGLLSHTKHGERFILAITDRFTKLTQATALRKILAQTVATVFFETWALKYCPPETLLLDNGTQFASRLFQKSLPPIGIK